MTYYYDLPPQKFHVIDFLEKYKIASSRTEFYNDERWRKEPIDRKTESPCYVGYIGYRTKSAYYILSPFISHERSPSCRVTIAFGVKCYASGKRMNLKNLKILLERGWIRSWNFRTLPLDKYNKMYKSKSIDNKVTFSSSAQKDELPF